MRSVAFRVDAGSVIGTGHAMRCIALADALRGQAVRIAFISRCMPSHLGKLILERKYELRILPQRDFDSNYSDELMHSRWLVVSQAMDAKDTMDALAGSHWDWLIVDHYGIDARWETSFRRVAGRLLVIDDLADRIHDCTLLLDASFNVNVRDRYSGKVPVDCQLLLGPQFALLRNEFQAERQRTGPRVGSIKRLLVSFGGIDVENVTVRTLRAIEATGHIGWEVDVVVGTENPNRAQIQTYCVAKGWSFHRETVRMAELMGTADLALGACGTSSWERCCVGLPAITIACAENQVSVGIELQKRELAIYLGPSEAVSIDILQRELGKFTFRSDALLEMSRRSYSVVDGLGTHRTRDAMLPG